MTARLALGVLLLGGVVSAAEVAPVAIGERPAVESHLDQSRIEAGEIGLEELLRHGRRLFAARFNTLDGQGRPETTGHGVPRPPGQPAFVRTSGPDANSCQGCHFQPAPGGAGEFSANVFVLAQERDPVVLSVDARDSLERGTVALFGAGAIEMLAREMSAELIAVREAAKVEARLAGRPVTRPLAAKGVAFGAITVLPDGRVDPRGIAGVDWDLVVRPFHQKGAVASLREFTNNALNHHHGMQSVERFGAGLDADRDGVVDELTVGDVTALTLFQAALPAPARCLSAHPARGAAAARGEQLFAAAGCTACHLTALVLDRPIYSDPGPFNPPGNLRSADVSRTVTLDLTAVPGTGLERRADGSALVRAFTDLKRHDLNDAEHQHLANELLAQGTLAARAPGAAFTDAPRARPPREFLTARLWDAGSTAPYGHRGDLTTLTEAIGVHGGEARQARDAFFALPPDEQGSIVEFLKTLQIAADGAPCEER